MTTTSASWTENQTGVDFDDTTPADTVTATADIDLAASGYDVVLAQIKITWDGGASDYADIALYSSADSGTTEDTIPLWSQRVSADAGNTDYISLLIENIPYAVITVENQSNAEIGSLDLIYAGRKWSSA